MSHAPPAPTPPTPNGPPWPFALVALLIGVAAFACGEDALDPGPAWRPAIDAGVTRCGPLEVVPLDHAESIAALPGGDLVLVGNSFDPFHAPSGHMIRFDPAGQRESEVIHLERSVAALTPAIDHLLLTDHGGFHSRWGVRPLELLDRLDPSEFDAVTASETALTPGNHLFVGGYERLGQHSPRTPSVMVYDLDLQRSPLSARLRRTDASGNVLGSVGEVTALLYLSGVDRVLVAGIDASPGDDPERFGFLAALGPTGLSFDLRHRPQAEFEPLKLVLDEQNRPWVLAVEGHSGNRYREAQPFMARVDPATLELRDRRVIELPDDASQGALLDAVALPDGGWIFGGSVCGEERTWCQAWLGRLDRRGQIVWSRRASRDVAATVSDLHLIGQRIVAAVSSSTYCCQWRELHQDGWLWSVDTDGTCPADNRLRRDGFVFR